jgi:hypothetical protein
MSLEWEAQMGRVKAALHEIRTAMDDWTAKNAFDENGIVVKSFVWIADTLDKLYASLKEIKEIGLGGFLKKHGVTEQPPIGVNPEFDEEQRRKLEEFRRGRGAPGRPGGAVLRLMGGDELQETDNAKEQLSYSEELVTEFRRFNALLSGEEKPVGLMSTSGMTPEQYSAAAPNLGPSASGRAEAFPTDMQMLSGLGAMVPWGSPGLFSHFSRLMGLMKQPTYDPSSGRTHNRPMGGAAGESHPVRHHRHARHPGGGAAHEAKEHHTGWTADTERAVRAKWHGATEGTGKGSWYGTYGEFRDIDPKTGKWQDKPGSASLGQKLGMSYFPEERQGIALPSGATLGRLFKVTWPDGHTSIEQHTDIGPAAKTGKFVDISAAAATREGYTPKTFPTGSQFSVEAVPTFGQESRMQRAAAAASIGRPGGEGIGLMGGVPETTPTSALRPSVRSFQAAQRAMLDRRTVDRGLAEESEIEPRGNLNVRVNAPAGTEVKANGDGMFKGNVSLERQLGLPTLQ